jgi:ubiquinol-cytochrome c reductase iron-sulfur subunit
MLYLESADGAAAGTTHSPQALAECVADARRRRLLVAGTTVLGGFGLLVSAVPFIESLEPSEAARAAGAPVDLDTSDIAAGALRTVAWRGKPVWVMRRTPEMVNALLQPNDVLVDPQSNRSEQPAACRNPTRSLTPDLFVCIGICTHLGCSPTLQVGTPDFDAQIHGPGGFYCPCHGSRFDLAGRVAKNVPAPVNLEIPPHTLAADGRLLIGS